MKGVTWTVKPSVSPEGTIVSVWLTAGENTGWFYLDADQAFNLSAELSSAAEWCKRHE